MEINFFKIILFSLFPLILNSCTNGDSNTPNQSLAGKYSGIFTVEYFNGESFSNTVTVVFNDKNNYQSSGNVNYIPAGGSGTYEKGNSTIDFSDINYWPANFDGNLILNGEYNYSIKGNELIISANKNDVGYYKYDLLKE